MPKLVLNARNVGKLAAPRKGRTMFWDAAPGSPPAFGVRVMRDGRRSYILREAGAPQPEPDPEPARPKREPCGYCNEGWIGTGSEEGPLERCPWCGGSGGTNPRDLGLTV